MSDDPETKRLLHSINEWLGWCAWWLFLIFVAYCRSCVDLNALAEHLKK